MSNESVNLYNNIKQNNGRIKKLFIISSNKGKKCSNNYFYFPTNQINFQTQVNFIKKEPILFNHQYQKYFSMHNLNYPSNEKDNKINRICNNFKSNSSSRLKISQHNIANNINDLNIKYKKKRNCSNDDSYKRKLNNQINYDGKDDYYKMNYFEKDLIIINDNMNKIKNFLEKNFKGNNPKFITREEYQKDIKNFYNKIIQLEKRINEKKYDEQNNVLLKKKINPNYFYLINEKYKNQNIDSNINIIQLLNIENKINQIKEELQEKQNEIYKLQKYLKHEFNNLIEQIDEKDITSTDDKNKLFENQINSIPNENQLIDLIHEIDENNNNNIVKNNDNDMINKYDSILKQFENINPDLYTFLSNQINNSEDNKNKKVNNLKKNKTEREIKMNQSNKNNSISSKNLIPLPFHKTIKKKYSKSYSIDKNNKKNFQFENKFIDIREVRSPSISPTTTITTESRFYDNSNNEIQKNLYYFEEKINNLIKENKKLIDEININLNNSDKNNKKELIEISNKQNIKILEIENKIIENNNKLNDIYEKIIIHEKNIQQLFEIEKKFQNNSIKNLSTNQSLNIKEFIHEKLQNQKDDSEEIILKNKKRLLKNILQSSNLISQNEKIICQENEKREIWIYKRPVIQRPILLYNNIEDINYQIELDEQDILNSENTNNNSTITSLKNSETNSLIISNTNSVNISNNESNKKNDNSSSSIKTKFLFLNNNYYTNLNEKEKSDEDEKRIEYEEGIEKEDNKEVSILNNLIKTKNIKKKEKNNYKSENENFSINKEICYNKDKNFEDITKSNYNNLTRNNLFFKNYTDKNDNAFIFKLRDNLKKENKKTEKEKSYRKYNHNEKNFEIKKEKNKIDNIKIEYKKINDKKNDEKNFNISIGKLIGDIKKKK